MIDAVYTNKAGQAELNDLHGKVAKALGTQLDDPKMMGHAIAFLRNNNITADVVDSNELVSLKDSITAIANKENKEVMTVEDMLAISEA